MRSLNETKGIPFDFLFFLFIYCSIEGWKKGCYHGSVPSRSPHDAGRPRRARIPSLYGTARLLHRPFRSTACSLRYPFARPRKWHDGSRRLWAIRPKVEQCPPPTPPRASSFMAIQRPSLHPPSRSTTFQYASRSLEVPSERPQSHPDASSFFLRRRK